VNASVLADALRVSLVLLWCWPTFLWRPSLPWSRAAHRTAAAQEGHRSPLGAALIEPDRFIAATQLASLWPPGAGWASRPRWLRTDRRTLPANWGQVRTASAGGLRLITFLRRGRGAGPQVHRCRTRCACWSWPSHGADRMGLRVAIWALNGAGNALRGCSASNRAA
jgi:hypothetical protein